MQCSTRVRSWKSVPWYPIASKFAFYPSRIEYNVYYWRDKDLQYRLGLAGIGKVSTVRVGLEIGLA